MLSVIVLDHVRSRFPVSVVLTETGKRQANVVTLKYVSLQQDNERALHNID
jgi:hypothetical protein